MSAPSSFTGAVPFKKIGGVQTCLRLTFGGAGQLQDIYKDADWLSMAEADILATNAKMMIRLVEIMLIDEKSGAKNWDDLGIDPDDPGFTAHECERPLLDAIFTFSLGKDYETAMAEQKAKLAEMQEQAKAEKEDPTPSSAPLNVSEDSPSDMGSSPQPSMPQTL